MTTTRKFPRMALATMIASVLLVPSHAAQDADKSYAVKSVYGTAETCGCKTRGIFAVWWDKKFDYEKQAGEVLDTLANVRGECLDTYKMSDPPNPLAGYYYNVYLHNGHDLFKPKRWAMGQGTDENRFPYLTIPIGYAKSNDSGLQHEGFHIFQYKANSPGFVYSGDSQWFIEASANWYAATKHPDSVEEYITASAVTSNPQVTLWYTYENRERGDGNNWQRTNHLYGMNTLLNYLTDVRQVPKAVIAGGFYGNVTELPQEYLFHQLGEGKFRDLYADYAAHNVGGFVSFPAGTEARAAKELKNYGNPQDVHPVVKTYDNEGTGGKWFRPPQDFVTRGWSYNVYEIHNSSDGGYDFQLQGDAKGSAGAAAEFRGRVVVRHDKAADVTSLEMSSATEGRIKLPVKASDREIFLVVAATPACFRGNQSYSYQIMIGHQ